MPDLFRNLGLKEEFEKISFLQHIHFGLVLSALFLELYYKVIGVSVIFKLLIIVILYRLYYKTLSKLYYTYWSFSGFLILYCLMGLFQNSFGKGHDYLFYLYFLTLFVLLVQGYMLSSPLYFPRVRWWEYDFRYKGDLKIEVQHESEKHPGRLTDLRRGAGCVVLFYQVEIGEIIYIYASLGSDDISLKAEVMSKREYSIGRGTSYGVKIIFDNEEGKDQFEKLTKYWKEMTSFKLQLKFRKDAGKSES